MGVFFIDTDTGQVATRRQLIEVGAATETQPPARPWLRIQAPDDASTLWYAVMRRRTRGVYIGTLCIRHGAHHASLLQRGWEEVAVRDIGLSPPPQAVP
ncbi:MAG TPA: hypothetical protein VKA96_01465 [Solirubrobacteraceae bacterium]|jgi:hypothetical protein|nr:hypothetical protein [Solirubrobacteraceae bacterium]